MQEEQNGGRSICILNALKLTVTQCHPQGDPPDLSLPCIGCAGMRPSVPGTTKRKPPEASECTWGEVDVEKIQARIKKKARKSGEDSARIRSQQGTSIGKSKHRASNASASSGVLRPAASTEEIPDPFPVHPSANLPRRIFVFSGDSQHISNDVYDETRPDVELPGPSTSSYNAAPSANGYGNGSYQLTNFQPSLNNNGWMMSDMRINIPYSFDYLPSTFTSSHPNVPQPQSVPLPFVGSTTEAQQNFSCSGSDPMDTTQFAPSRQTTVPTPASPTHAIDNDDRQGFFPTSGFAPTVGAFGMSLAPPAQPQFLNDAEQPGYAAPHVREQQMSNADVVTSNGVGHF